MPVSTHQRPDYMPTAEPLTPAGMYQQLGPHARDQIASPCFKAGRFTEAGIIDCRCEQTNCNLEYFCEVMAACILLDQDGRGITVPSALRRFRRLLPKPHPDMPKARDRETLCAIACSLGVRKISYRNFESTHGVLRTTPEGGHEILIKTPATNDTYMQVIPTFAHEIGHLLIRKDDAGEMDTWVSQVRSQVPSAFSDSAPPARTCLRIPPMKGR